MKPRNVDVLGTCTFSVLSVNTSDNTVQIRVTAQAQPNNLFGYSNNVYTQVTCNVYDTSANLLASYAPGQNSPTLPTTSITPIVPFSSDYTLCGQAFVKKKDGSQSLTPGACA